MYRLLIAALLAVLLVGPANAITHFPSGIIVGDINDSPSTTPGEDDLYVKGTFEVDGASDLDSTLNVEGAVTLQSTISVDGAATFNGAVTLGNAAGDSITLTGTLISSTDISLNNKDLVLGDGDEYGFSIDSNNNTFRLLGSANQDTLRGVSIMTATTSTVTFSQGVTLTAAKEVTVPATAYATRWRIGTGSSSGHSADGVDCLFVEGIAEVDGALFADGAATVAGALTADGNLTITDDDLIIGDGSNLAFKIDAGSNTLNIAGSSTPGAGLRDTNMMTLTTAAVTITPAVVANGNLTVTDDDIIVGDATRLAFALDAASNVLRVFGSSDPDNLRDTQAMAISTSAVNVYENLGIGAADGNDDKTITLYAGDKTDATLIYDYSDDDIDINKTLSVTGGGTFSASVTMNGGATLGDAVTDVVTCTGGLVITASSTCPYQATTPAGAIWMTASSSNPGDNEYISDGAGSHEAAAANRIYFWNGSIWVPFFTGSL